MLTKATLTISLHIAVKVQHVSVVRRTGATVQRALEALLAQDVCIAEVISSATVHCRDTIKRERLREVAKYTFSYLE